MRERLIQFLWFDGCPLADRQRAQLDAALAELPSADRPSVSAVDLMAEETPEDLRRWGSPTILIDGRDLVGSAPGAACSCRLYDGPEGVIGSAEILAALERVR